jgi:bifunctional DNA-binding transcriptional regulator/antitoxin component of YhaV-PrlF toxin-antitoxin module
MAANGRLVIAAPMRKELGLGAESAVFLAEVVNGRLILTPADVVPRAEREWLASPEVTALLDQADRHIADGAVQPLIRADIARLRTERATKTASLS